MLQFQVYRPHHFPYSIPLMDAYRIKGGVPLYGKVEVSGAKNAALPLFAASLLFRDPVIINNVPDVQDIHTMAELLKQLGVKVTRIGRNTWRVHADEIENPVAPYETVKKMRASIYVLAPLLLRKGEAKVSLPGGCAFGPRPVNFHLEGLTLLGAKVNIEHGYIRAEASHLSGCDISFDKKSVGATIHMMMAASLARGKTTIKNAALEPEVVVTAEFLKRAGAMIRGAGTDTIEITGVGSLNTPGEFKNIPDRIEAGTFLVSVAITGGEIEIVDLIPHHLATAIDKARRLGLQVEVEEDRLMVKRSGYLRSLEIVTSPFPGFPTDLQPIFMAALSLAKGTSIIKEEIYPDRFIHAYELNRLGAKIRVEGDTAIVEGVDELQGAPVMASDLRAGASLILAGLGARGETIVQRIYHVDRGYEDLEKKLSKLGARIERIRV